MKILIVEDDENNIELFQTELAGNPRYQATFAKSRDSAVAALAGTAFDIIVIDLKIPTQDGGLDSDLNHGLFVHSRVQEVSRGTPIIVFSAFGTVKIAAGLAEGSERHDPWGCGQDQAMTVYKEKSDFKDCLAHLIRATEHVAALMNIDVSTGGRPLNLTEDQKRILRIFSRLNQGANVSVSLLGGGLSSAKTVRLEVQNEHGARTTAAVAKLGSIKDLLDEENRYHRCIAPCLNVGGFAHLIRYLRAGAANTGGIFYGFARDYRQSLLDVLQAEPAQAAATIGHLRRLEENWQSNAVPKLIAVADIRRSLLSDTVFATHATRLGFDWAALEKIQVRANWCCQHRDLHCLNVLVQGNETPLLIDYGEVEPAPACLDPLVLELSLLFHPACQTVRGGWPSVAQAEAWANLDAYSSGTPLSPFIRACREWAFAVEPVDKAVYATAYAFAVRQLKFAGVDQNVVQAIAKAANDAVLA